MERISKEELEALRDSELFDEKWYLDQYPDVKMLGMDALEHYLWVGEKMSRRPSPKFDGTTYLELHADVARAGVHPLLHYAKWGKKEGRALHKPSVKKKDAPIHVPASMQARNPIIDCPPAISAIRSAPTQPTKRPMLSIVVLNRNGEKLLNEMLRSFYAVNTYENYEFIVVDHASDDGSVHVLRSWEAFIPMKIVACDQNYSFSHSNNRAAELSSGQYLLLVNNDVVFTRDILAEMVAVLEDESIGAVGLKQYLGDPNEIGPHEIYHIGIRFEWDHDGKFLKPRNQSGTPLDSVLASSLSSFPAVTASVLLCRKEDYFAIGGLEEGYFYGYEDVDFCLKMRFIHGKDVVSLNRTFAFHNESSTRSLEHRDDVRRQRLSNRTLLRERFGYQLRRDFVQSLFADDGSFSGRTVRVGIAVTTTKMDSGAGDLYTAFGLGEALRTQYGWDVRYLPKGQWNDASELDIYISMRDDVDIRELKSAEPHLIMIAWMRNWLERWCERPWTNLFDIHLCSSQHGIDFVSNNLGIHCHLFPIAANLALFNRGPSDKDYETDYAFTGNYWKAPIPREIEAFQPSSVDGKFSVYGKNWNEHDNFSPYHKGFISYTELPKLYSSAKITIDDTVSHVTKLWGSMNSRVFEALASGSLVLTNNVIGADELFEGKLPSWNNVDELSSLLTHYLGNHGELEALVSDLRAEVVRNHSYEARAEFLHRLILNSSQSLKVAIKCPVPRASEAEAWGDFHFARSLQRALRNLGYIVRIDLLPEWDSLRSVADDVVIVLRGLSAYEPSPDQLNLCWLISHPDKVTSAELEKYDHVFVASRVYAEELNEKLNVPVSVLLQCSDPEVFFPMAEEDEKSFGDELLFVGNSRKQDRKIVRECLDLGLSISIYGRDWEGRVPEDVLKGDYIPNAELRRFYGSAKIVLNDHWPDMARNGFISNRIFDVALSGGFLISDSFADEEVFAGAIVTCKDASDLAKQYNYWIKDDEGRRKISESLRAKVLMSHTFAHRASAIDEVISNHHSARMSSSTARENAMRKDAA